MTNCTFVNIYWTKELQDDNQPVGLTIHSSVEFYSEEIATIPDGLVVSGYLDISSTKIIQLPKNLDIMGNFCIPDDLDKLFMLARTAPSSLRVGGNVWLLSPDGSDMYSAMTFDNFQGLAHDIYHQNKMA